MPIRTKTIILVLSLSGIVAAGWLFFRGHSGPEWGVLVIGLPSRISTKDAFQTTSYYILKQTHEPVLRKDDGQKYSSKILKSWRRNLESSEYEFCPDTFIKFSDTAPFSSAFFLSHMESITGAYDASASVKRLGDCVFVSFQHGRKGYLDYLTRYENAPSIRRTEYIEDGLGKYSVESVSQDTIVLKRKEPVSDGYEIVSFHEYKGKNDPNLQNRNIKDFNLIPISNVPDWATAGYFSLDTVELKSINLIINHHNLEVRKAVYNCLNTTELRHSLFPLKKDFYDIQTILPIGLPGASGGTPTQQCAAYMGKAPVPLVFANWNEDSRVPLTEYINALNARTGMKVRVVNYAPKDLLKKIHSSPHPYNLVVIILDAIRPDYSAFFPPFFSENGYYDFDLGALREKYVALQKEEDPGKKARLATGVAQELADKAVVLTLYQNVKILYFPKEIKHLAVGKGFLQYPEVAALQI